MDVAGCAGSELWSGDAFGLATSFGAGVVKKSLWELRVHTENGRKVAFVVGPFGQRQMVLGGRRPVRSRSLRGGWQLIWRDGSCGA